MSVINKMLQELDRRHGMAMPGPSMPPWEVRTVPRPRPDRRWFWRGLAAVAVLAIAWAAWVAYQIWPRALANAGAIMAADEARRATAAQGTPTGSPVPVAPARSQSPAAERGGPEAPVAATVGERPRKPERSGPHEPAVRKPPKAAAAPTPQDKERQATQPEGRAPMASNPARLVGQDRSRSNAEKAEVEFRRAMALFNEARVSEAEKALAATLALAPSHEAARQTLIALCLEGQRIDEASRLLREGLALNPGNVLFATVLARIFVERRDYGAALEVLAAARSGVSGNNAEYHSLLGAVLQRLARHEEAAEAYRATLQAAPGNGSAWLGLGISLEALGRRPEAAEAFRRAAASGSLPPDARVYAEQRSRQAP